MKQTTLKEAITALQAVKAEICCPGTFDKTTIMNEAQLAIDYLQKMAEHREEGKKILIDFSEAIEEAFSCLSMLRENDQ